MSVDGIDGAAADRIVGVVFNKRSPEITGISQGVFLYSEEGESCIGRLKASFKNYGLSDFLQEQYESWNSLCHSHTRCKRDKFYGLCNWYFQDYTSDA